VLVSGYRLTLWSYGVCTSFCAVKH